MKKIFALLALVATLTSLDATALDVLASPSQAEDEVIRIIERVLGVVGDFIGSVLDSLAEFLKDIIPFIGGGE